MSTTFIELMRDPDFIRRERAAQEEAAYRQKARQEKRNAYLEQHGKPSPADLRAMVTRERDFHFEHDAHRRRSGAGSPQANGGNRRGQ